MNTKQWLIVAAGAAFLFIEHRKGNVDWTMPWSKKP